MRLQSGLHARITTEVTDMSNRKDIERINSAFEALEVLNFGWTREERDKVFAFAVEEEELHRGSETRFRCTIEEAARMTVVRDLAAFVTDTVPIPTIAQVISFRPSHIYAASIAANYRTEIMDALKPHNILWLASLDYVKLVNNEPQLPPV